VLARLGSTPFTYNPTPLFADEPATDPLFKYVQELLAIGITSGCATAVPPATLGTYCPTNS